MRGRFRRLVALLAAGALAGCALIDLRGFLVATLPSSANQLLEGAASVWVEFPEPVVKSRVEPLLSVCEEGARLSGVLSWDGNRLSFSPVRPFTPGALHRLQLLGRIETIAGRSIPLRIDLPFYVGTTAPPPTVDSVEPADGSIVGLRQSLTIAFSQPMDVASFHDAFSISPATDHTERWNGEGTLVTLQPARSWAAESLHTWRLAVGCRARSGTALPRQSSGTFLVQLDATLPQVLSADPATVAGASFAVLPGGLSALRFRDSILITLSEEVEPTSLARALSISPTIAGAIHHVATRQHAFVPAEGWLQSQEYLLTISTELTDPSGNPLAAPYRVAFTPAIPPQVITEVALAGDLEGGPVLCPQPTPEASAPLLLDWVGRSIKPELELELVLRIRFAEGYEGSYRTAIAGAIDLAGYVPASLTSPRLLQASWLDDHNLVLTYVGFVRSRLDPATGTGRLYYRLMIPAGRALTINQAGSFLSGALTLLFESGSDRSD